MSGLERRWITTGGGDGRNFLAYDTVDEALAVRGRKASGRSRVVPADHAEQLRAAVEEIERLRDELEDTRADWARMKGVAERRGKAVEALREVARLLGRSTSTLAAAPTGDEWEALTIANGALERLQKATLGE